MPTATASPSEGYFFALDAASGVKKWRADVPDYTPLLSPTVVGDQVFIPEDGTEIAIVDVSDGQVLERLYVEHNQKSPPVVVDGMIFVGTSYGLFAYGNG